MKKSQWLKTILRRLEVRPASKAQSLIELALVLPILIIMLLGIAEVALFMGRYLDILDLTREAARLASLNDPTVYIAAPTKNCSDSQPENIEYYYRVACIFSPPDPTKEPGSVCDNSNFCNGFNRYIDFDLTRDDVIISGYTINNNTVSSTWPASGYWSLSKDGMGDAEANWTKDCQGNTLAGSTPYYTSSRINGLIQGTIATMAAATPAVSYDPASAKGFVAVEAYYCYHQIMGIPILSNFVPNPVRIHAYTLMPLPAVQPTLTPYTPSP